MPECFKTRYPKTRVILDCTEIRVQRPSSKVLNSEFYSAYKSHTTLKCLVGIALHGAVTFVSSLLGKYIRQRDNKMQWIFWPVGGRMDGSWNHTRSIVPDNLILKSKCQMKVAYNLHDSRNGNLGCRLYILFYQCFKRQIMPLHYLKVEGGGIQSIPCISSVP